jgi:alkanesulfonate monooxygenase SsuD/methylene tetrahydromethanopterin reductase-like flavin-dependent oxidoreductase (luciferase family)
LPKYYLPLVIDIKDLTRVTKVARRAEELGYFGIGVGEHYSLPGKPNGRPDAFVLLSALVPGTSKLRLGTLASSASVRHPVVLANTALSLHVLSGGRSFLCLGVGSGTDAEYSSHGFKYVAKAERLNVFEETLAIIRGLSMNRNDFSFKGSNYALDGSVLNIADDFPPVWVGERRSKRLLKLAGRYADVLNIHCATPLQAQEKLNVALQAATDAGRRKESVGTVLKHFVVMESDQDLLTEALDYPKSKREGESATAFIDRMRSENPEAIIGTPDQVRAEYEKYVVAGFEEFSPILLPNAIGEIEGRMETFAKKCMA